LFVPHARVFYFDVLRADAFAVIHREPRAEQSPGTNNQAKHNDDRLPVGRQPERTHALARANNQLPLGEKSLECFLDAV